MFGQGQSNIQQMDRSDIATDRSTIYPTRVLDLEVLIKDSMDIQLIENLTPDSRHATLSHCWGYKSDTGYQATTSNLRDLKERIQYADLPRTYCDAISVCRALKVRYLWIDSLCIIQDSKEDWEREAANMAYVYSNSYLSILADWSTDSDGGCFKTSSREPKRPKMDLFDSIRLTNVLSSGQQKLSLFSSARHLNTIRTWTILIWLAGPGCTKRGFYPDAISTLLKISSFGNVGVGLLLKIWCLANLALWYQLRFFRGIGMI
jgi:hypothetical protein